MRGIRGTLPRASRKTLFCLTLNNYTTAEYASAKDMVEAGIFSYFFGGKEIGENGTPHLQCCARTTQPISIVALRRRIADVTKSPCRWHIEVMKCPLPKNRQYCSKGNQSHEEWLEFNELGPNYGVGADTFEFGTKPKGRGHRSDLDDVAAAVRSGKTEHEISESYGASFIKYYGGIRELINVSRDQERTSMTQGYWCYGPTGSGKSRWAHSIPGAKYSKDPTNKWFDGYRSQPTLIIDDYRPSKELNFSQLLRLADRYPMSVERKGGTMQFNSKRVVVTTPLDIASTFAHLEFLTEGSLDQLRRRFIELPFEANGLTPHLSILESLADTPPVSVTQELLLEPCAEAALPTEEDLETTVCELTS